MPCCQLKTGLPGLTSGPCSPRDERLTDSVAGPIHPTITRGGCRSAIGCQPDRRPDARRLGRLNLLLNGGTGYLPSRMLRPHELTGRVHCVAGAPEFPLPAYVQYEDGVDGLDQRAFDAAAEEISGAARALPG